MEKQPLGTIQEKGDCPIYTEAQRMVQLVENIISHSHLDEGADDMKQEEVDLCGLAKSVVLNLEPGAKAAGITLEMPGARVGEKNNPLLDL